MKRLNDFEAFKRAFIGFEGVEAKNGKELKSRGKSIIGRI